MRRFRCALVATVAMGFTSIASAADMPTKGPVYKEPVAVVANNWTGFYAGVNAGYAWGHSDALSTLTCPVTGACNYNGANLAAVTAAGTGTMNPRGFTGGIQFGYNWQTGNILIGAEMDFNSFHLSASRTVTGPVPTAPAFSFTATTGVDTNWLFTARTRLGWVAAPNLLVYGTGGLALTSLKVSNSFSDTLIPVSTGASNSSRTQAGWALGGGMEWALAGNWTVRGEYLYVDFGSVTTISSVNSAIAPASVSNNFATSVDLRSHIARMAISYKFGR